jgi:FkbM family methyltransferase
MNGSYWIVNTNYGAFLTDKNDFIGSKVYQDCVWEPEIIEIYESLLQPHYIVVDIGAHMGFHTVNFAKNSKQVYAFEPQLHLYNQVCGNIFLNELNGKITCFNVGLGETNKRSSFGSLDKHNSLNWDGNWEVELINYGGRSLEDDLGTNEIEIRTLDSFAITPHFIKMDVEGYELKTLQGAKQTLEKSHPILFFESFPEYQEDVFNFLKGIGYEIFIIPHTAQSVDFIAIHPKFEDYVSVKYKINKLK